VAGNVIFEPTDLQGAFVIHLQRLVDDRGSFARTFCKKEFQAHGLLGDFVQCNASFNKTRGTLRGMHYQTTPHQEVKLIRCTRGAIYDVIIDLVPTSATYLQWTSLELTPDNGKMLYVPEHFAHGYQTLSDDTEVFYQVSEFYSRESERGVRWDDPAFPIKWPDRKHVILSPKDRGWPDYIGHKET